MTRTLKLGFHTRVPFPAGRVAEGVREGIELFRAGEDLGYDRGWVYQRHFDNYLASPLVYLPVVAQHTERIGLGTAIIGIRYEDPVLLAEAASIADHLTDGRLQLGLSTGQGGYDAAFGQPVNDGREQSQRRLATFLRGIRGESVGEATDREGDPIGEELRIRGASAGLPGRVWFGGGSVASAERIGSQGLRLMLSTILTDSVEDYNAEQLRAIEAYRAAHTGPEAPRVSVSRSILPATSPETARRYAAYDEERRTQGPAASRPAGALDPRVLPAAKFSVSGAIHGDPEHVVEQLLADVAVAEADELIAFLPPAFGLAENLRLIEDIVTHVAPHLGWQPAV
ncbi:LLM class flavin-dependent oxidoreductase [Microbacteriaceae bacterium VKM Ac-2854]|nr:LLM class flavin-dependent oxidoreductase [Microbacteriaceae bacterium VKM Ac-2854]